MNILIKNGTIITSEKLQKADILIANGKISCIGDHLSIPDRKKLIDAAGKYIIPGGIDPHVHMHLPTPAGYSTDDFFSGSIAALYGGTTTLLDFVTPNKGQSLVEALALREKEAENSLTDYSFHVSPIDWHDGIEDEIMECRKMGITSFKVYLAYLDSIGLSWEIFRKVLRTVGKIGGIVTIHAEMGLEIDRLRDQFYIEGKTEAKYHPLSRPPRLEAEAVKKAIQIAREEDCPIYIVHVSAGDSIRYIEEAQKRGQEIYAETCPQYLLLDDSKYKGDFNETASFVLSPPLRTKSDNKALWDAIDKGVIQTIGTDHCPFMKSQKEMGKDDFRKIPNGAGGVEHRLELLYTYGVLQNRISLQQWIDLCCTQAAKIFGLFPKKGTIGIGSDADLVIWNPDTQRIISTKTHNQNCDSNIYEGFKTKGIAETVIKNGKIVIENGIMVAEISKGKFLRR